MKALQESGIAYDPDDVVWFHTEDRKVKPALMAKEMVQSGQLPDGIVCYNDQIAVQVMEELEKMGVEKNLQGKFPCRRSGCSFISARRKRIYYFD